MSAVVFVHGIDIRTCVWCGEGYVALKTGRRPIITCSAACRADNARYAKSEYERKNAWRKAAYEVAP